MIFLSQGCDIIVALTHMRFPNDIRLAENTKGIDLILGGHDHVYDVKHVRRFEN
jgi:5'-nucleotidase